MNTYLITCDDTSCKKDEPIAEKIVANFTGYCILFPNVFLITSEKSEGSIRDYFQSKKIPCVVFTASTNKVCVGWASYDIDKKNTEWMKKCIK